MDPDVKAAVDGLLMLGWSKHCSLGIGLGKKMAERTFREVSLECSEGFRYTCSVHVCKINKHLHVHVVGDESRRFVACGGATKTACHRVDWRRFSEEVLNHKLLVEEIRGDLHLKFEVVFAIEPHRTHVFEVLCRPCA